MSQTAGPSRNLSVGDKCPACGRVVTETAASGLLAYCWWCNDRSASEPTTDDLVPAAFEKYQNCPDCDVTVHGPQYANSSGGCHVLFCEEHAGDWE